MGEKELRDIEVQKPASFALSENGPVNALRDLITGLGYDLLTMTPADKGAVADKLSRVALQSPAWTWRYVHNVLGRKVDASARFTGAILRMLAVLDGANPLMVSVHPVQVYAARVSPGAVVLAASRKCANPACPIEFVPIVPRQRFCCADCRRRKPIK